MNICEKCIKNGKDDGDSPCPICKYYPQYLELQLQKAKDIIHHAANKHEEMEKEIAALTPLT